MKRVGVEDAVDVPSDKSQGRDGLLEEVLFGRARAFLGVVARESIDPGGFLDGDCLCAWEGAILFELETSFNCSLPQVRELLPDVGADSRGRAGARDGWEGAGVGGELCEKGIVVGDREVERGEGGAGMPCLWVLEGVVKLGCASEVVAGPGVTRVG